MLQLEASKLFIFSRLDNVEHTADGNNCIPRLHNMAAVHAISEEGAGALEGEGSFKRMQGSGSNRGRQSRLADSQSAFNASADHHDAQDSAASDHGGLIISIKSWMMGAEAADAHR